MSFTITKILLDGPKSGEAKRHNETLKFRLLDDDGEIYFFGYMTPTQSEALFAPLDEFGEAYGCTEIQILENGWQTV
jgi:hypothetical protein